MDKFNQGINRPGGGPITYTVQHTGCCRGCTSGCNNNANANTNPYANMGKTIAKVSEKIWNLTKKQIYLIVCVYVFSYVFFRHETCGSCRYGY